MTIPIDVARIARCLYASNGGGLTAKYLVERKRLPLDKAQNKLEYALAKGELATLGRSRPQEYYPPKVLERRKPVVSDSVQEDLLMRYLLQADRLSASIHSMQFLTEFDPFWYSILKDEVDIFHNPDWKRNRSKQYQVGKKVDGISIGAQVSSTGSVQIFSQTTNHTMRFSDEGDVFSLICQFGGWRQALIDRGMPSVIPNVQKWRLIQFDLNKDIRLKGARLPLHLSGLPIESACGVFYAYVKTLPTANVLRIEKRVKYKDKPPVGEGLLRALAEFPSELNVVIGKQATPLAF